MPRLKLIPSWGERQPWETILEWGLQRLWSQRVQVAESLYQTVKHAGKGSTTPVVRGRSLQPKETQKCDSPELEGGGWINLGPHSCHSVLWSLKTMSGESDILICLYPVVWSMQMETGKYKPRTSTCPDLRAVECFLAPLGNIT